MITRLLLEIRIQNIIHVTTKDNFKTETEQ